MQKHLRARRVMPIAWCFSRINSRCQCVGYEQPSLQNIRCAMTTHTVTRCHGSNAVLGRRRSLSAILVGASGIPQRPSSPDATITSLVPSWSWWRGMRPPGRCPVRAGICMDRRGAAGSARSAQRWTMGAIDQAVWALKEYRLAIPGAARSATRRGAGCNSCWLGEGCNGVRPGHASSGGSRGDAA